MKNNRFFMFCKKKESYIVNIPIIIVSQFITMSTNQNQNLYVSDCYTFICSFNVWYRKIIL